MIDDLRFWKQKVLGYVCFLQLNLGPIMDGKWKMQNIGTDPMAGRYLAGGLVEGIPPSMTISVTFVQIWWFHRKLHLYWSCTAQCFVVVFSLSFLFVACVGQSWLFVSFLITRKWKPHRFDLIWKLKLSQAPYRGLIWAHFVLPTDSLNLNPYVQIPDTVTSGDRYN